MFRLCVDLVTRPLLPDPSDTTVKQLNEKTRRDLGLRLRWMFDNKLIDPALRELVSRFRSSYAHFACVSSVRRQKRSMDARMASADFVQRNGLGAAFLILI
jgi:hypothetical protein